MLQMWAEERKKEYFDRKVSLSSLWFLAENAEDSPVLQVFLLSSGAHKNICFQLYGTIGYIPRTTKDELK